MRSHSSHRSSPGTRAGSRWSCRTAPRRRSWTSPPSCTGWKPEAEPPSTAPDGPPTLGRTRVAIRAGAAKEESTMAADHDAPEREPGTTHAEHGAGDPQLVAVREPGGDLGERLVFSLRREETTVGSAEDQDIRLDGLRPAHFVILHDGRDEYRLRELAEVGG